MVLLTTAVAVFTNNVGMAASCRCSKAFADEVAEARGVKHRATANDLVLGQATQLPSEVRQNVHWNNCMILSDNFSYYEKSSVSLLVLLLLLLHTASDRLGAQSIYLFIPIFKECVYTLLGFVQTIKHGTS